jgi:DNA polymerase-2
VIGAFGASLQKDSMKTMDGESCLRLTFDSLDEFHRARRSLERHSIRTYEADVSLVDQYLLPLHIHGCLKIEGTSRDGRYVDRIFLNPRVTHAEWDPQLSILSIDIETDPQMSEIRAISMNGRDPWRDETVKTVLFRGKTGNKDWIETFDDEKSMLEAFCKRTVDFDPDIITGWNVIDFDFKVIARRFEDLGLPFLIGRSSEPAVLLPSQQTRQAKVILPGRQVLDAMWLVRASPDRYNDYRLETVAGEILGRGKTLTFTDDQDKGEQLEDMYHADPLSYCRYSLEDARLVLDILESTGLVELTVRRCLLTGISPERAWTSIPPFERLYMEGLHLRNRVAPSLGVDAGAIGGAPGGAILEPQPGLFDNVFVFDFKSLYPSIIRTFQIDPLNLVTAGSRPDAEVIKAPNGARFRRDPGILPELLDRFFESRDQAKQDGDTLASYVYKIIMNSFYGVLGTSGCRFAASELSGAITSFGQSLLHWLKQYFLDMGCEVIYGDTDSVFIKIDDRDEASPQTLYARGDEIARRANSDLADYLADAYNLSSRLELEFEKIYLRFFIPPVRGYALQDGNRLSGRGRAKGYAGLLLTRENKRKEPDIEIKGMEAVRRDWTALAREFQIRMLTDIFNRKPLSHLRSYIRTTIDSLLSGHLDDKLVYRKALRKPPSEYTRTRPPHVKAAELLGLNHQRGIIHYVITRDGPQPVSRLSAPIDYRHYVNKQLKPIAESFASVTGADIKQLLETHEQYSLF